MSRMTDAPPVRLLFLVTTFDRGGAEKIIARLATSLPRDRYAVAVAALQGRSGRIVAELVAGGVPAHDLRMRNKLDLGAALRLRALLRRERIEVLYSFLFHANLMGRLVGGWCGVPVRIGAERIAGWDGPLRRLLNRLTARLTTGVVAVSEAVRDEAARTLGVAPEWITVIPNGVNTEEFTPASCPIVAPVIGCTGRLHWKNDQRTLLEAFAAVRQAVPEARLLLVGDGEERGALERMVARHNWGEAVTFAGEHPDVGPWLHRTAVYVQPSVSEGMANSILEAMACGLPVVATRVGGTPEVVEDGVSGLLVPPKDPAALATALVTLLADSALRVAMGSAGRKRVVRQFNEADMIRRTTTFLDSVVNAAHLRPPVYGTHVAAIAEPVRPRARGHSEDLDAAADAVGVTHHVRRPTAHPGERTAPMVERAIYDLAVTFYRHVEQEISSTCSHLGEEEARQLRAYYRNLARHPRRAPYYRHNWARRLMGITKEILTSNGNLDILDAGCGVGTEAIFLASLRGGITVRGLDCHSPRLLTAQRRKAYYEGLLNRELRVSFHNGDAISIPAGRTFDLIWLMESISHINPAETFLEKIPHLLRGGGVVGISDSNFLNPIMLWRVLCLRRKGVHSSEAVNQETGEVVEMAEERLFAPRTVVRKLVSLGLRLKARSGGGFFPPVVGQIRGIAGRLSDLEDFCQKVPGLAGLSGIYTVIAQKP